jgi:hypothetical protein
LSFRHLNFEKLAGMLESRAAAKDWSSGFDRLAQGGKERGGLKRDHYPPARKGRSNSVLRLRESTFGRVKRGEKIERAVTLVML